MIFASVCCWNWKVQCFIFEQHIPPPCEEYGKLTIILTGKLVDFQMRQHLQPGKSVRHAFGYEFCQCLCALTKCRDGIVDMVDDIHQFCHQSYCGNPSIVSSDLGRMTQLLLWDVNQLLSNLNSHSRSDDTIGGLVLNLLPQMCSRMSTRIMLIQICFCCHRSTFYI